MIYSAYGLRIQSQLELPELAISNVSGPADVVIRFGLIADYYTSSVSQNDYHFKASPNQFYLCEPGIANFLAIDGKEIIIERQPAGDDDGIRLYLLGSLLGAILFQRGLFVLHGNAIRIGNYGMVCIGDSGAGKSTTAAAFMQRGYQVLADDVVPLDQEFRIQPGIPRIKLWEDSTEMLGIDSAVLPRIRQNVNKFSLRSDDIALMEPLPIRWVYILEKGEVPHVTMESVLGIQKFQNFYRHTYRVHYLNGMGLSGDHFNFCESISKHVQVSRITRPENILCVDEVVDMITNDISMSA